MVVHSLFPILLTRDLPRLADFYERALGGTVDYRFDDGGEDVYVSLSIGAASLGIGKDTAAPDASVGDRVALWFYVDDVDSRVRRVPLARRRTGAASGRHALGRAGRADA